ncbi:MAG TPA: hypothetical protein VNQ73_17320 [Ilumatobacter sp.]|nr:hypothetical protein [Ilumatobacter sp.]
MTATVLTATVLAADLALIALAVGVVGMIGFTTAILMGITSFELRRKPPPRLALPPAPTRRVITGTPARLPAAPPLVGPLVPDAAPDDATASAAPVIMPTDLTAVEYAERTILRLMDENPDVVVRVISAWIAQDDEPRRTAAT